MSYTSASAQGSSAGSFNNNDTVTNCGGTGTNEWTITGLVNRNDSSTRDDFFRGNCSKENALIRANNSDLEVGRPGGTNYNSSLTVPDTGFSFIGIAYENSVTEMTLHVDGQNQTDTGAALGQLTSLKLSNIFAGTMDDVQVYNTRLSTTQLNDINSQS
jgi:hypothetical protein